MQHFLVHVHPCSLVVATATIPVELGENPCSHPRMIKSGIGIAVAGVAFVVFGLGAGWVATQLIRSNRAAVIATLPLLREQTVAIEAPGELVVSIEVPRLTTDYRQWEIEVVEAHTKRAHGMRYSGPRATGAVKGLSTIKIPLGRLTLAQPGELTLRVKGLAPDANYTAYHIVLARPHLARIALQVVGVVVCGVGMLLSLLRALWLMGVLKAA
jgi:hypothetical protein